MREPASTSRRDFLRASAFATAIFGAESSLLSQETRKSRSSSGQARNVIFMVSDGMNHGALSLANTFQARFHQKSTHWADLYRQRPVVRSLVETFSANSIVTDSAAAASAWGGGQRVANGTLNVLPSGEKTVTLHQKFHTAGLQTGLVTTATITHATPAGFAANVDSRGAEEIIAQQYLERQVDVLLGGGRKFYSDSLLKKYAAGGYDVVEKRAELENLKLHKDKRLLGVFTPSHIHFSIDTENDPTLAAEVPPLSLMTEVALNRLSMAPDGFFLLVEGARIDHAGHQNDAASSIHDQLAFDNAIGVALKYVDSHPDTLLIITTDHGCGGIQMNGMSAKKDQGFAPGIYAGSTPAFDRIHGFKHSFEWMKRNEMEGYSGSKLAEALKEHTGLSLSENEIKDAQGLKTSKLAEIYKQYHGIGWTSANHTGELVEFCAYGPGSNLFPAFLENRQEHNLILRAMGVA